ncbi:hypothetical protein CY35_17G102900 [Sphagnum magellanicum]|nr:hypothetical protein CY35_17G102900 [Sphagnum magellanicum]
MNQRHDLCSFPFCTTSKLQIQKPSRQEEKHYPNPIFWKAPHSHPCLLLLPHFIPSYMVMFPEEKLSKSCIQEALNSQPCLPLLAHSIPHYMVMFP